MIWDHFRDCDGKLSLHEYIGIVLGCKENGWQVDEDKATHISEYEQLNRFCAFLFASFKQILT